MYPIIPPTLLVDFIPSFQGKKPTGRFDVSGQVVALSYAQLMALKDNSNGSDELALDLLRTLGHTGPFSVKVERGLARFLKLHHVPRLEALTPTRWAEIQSLYR